MSPLKLCYALSVASLCHSASGGDFTVTDSDYSSVSVHYTGDVESSDVWQWHILTGIIGDRVVLLTIDSPGGSAYGGLDLYWALEAHPRLVTIAGAQQGAWSAAALMWLAGDHQLIAKNGAVWFHAAYCQWDSEPMPDIGCDTTEFQQLLIKLFDNAGYNGKAFNQALNYIQATHGTDGWIGADIERWWTRDTTEWTWDIFDKDLIQ